MDILKHKLIDLQQQLAALSIDKCFALAFSGGIDSRFITHAALLAGLRPLLIHASGHHINAEETLFARTWAQSCYADFLEMPLHPLEIPAVAANTRERCYHCKKELFTRLKEKANCLQLCDGTQASDLQSYRPGIVALQELGIISPLLRSNLTKPEIRQLAAQTGMSTPEQRARPCLLTRFAYNLSPSPQQLMMIAQAEQLVEETLQRWVQQTPDARPPDFRLRQINPETLELHLTPVDELNLQEIPPKLLQILEIALKTITTYSMKGKIKVMPKLSGYFDLNISNN